jgi:SPP1 family predicted phage head-tail adaptor
MPIAAGKLREPVRIEVEQRTSNGQGGYITAWTKVADVRAEILGLAGDEALRAGVERSVSQYRVTIRKRSDVSVVNRLKWKGQVLAIRSVLPHPNDLRRALLLNCEIGNGS